MADDINTSPERIQDPSDAIAAKAKQQDQFLKVLSPQILQALLGSAPGKQQQVQQQLAQANALRQSAQQSQERLNPSPTGQGLSSLGNTMSSLAGNIRGHRAEHQQGDIADKNYAAMQAAMSIKLKQLGIDPATVFGGGGQPDMSQQNPTAEGSPIDDQPMMKGGDAGQAQPTSLDQLLGGGGQGVDLGLQGTGGVLPPGMNPMLRLQQGQYGDAGSD